MDPITMGALISGAFGFGGSLLGGGGSDGPQKRHSFAGSGKTDPKAMLASLMGSIDSVGSGLEKKMRDGVRLRSGPVPSAPGFSKDPAAIDPSILQRPGFDFGGMAGGQGPFVPTAKTRAAEAASAEEERKTRRLGVNGRWTNPREQ